METPFLCHLDSCAGMNTGSLLLHQWIITTFPQIVKSYQQFDDLHGFEPLILDCAVPIETSDPLSGKLTAVVEYYTWYVTADNKPVTIAFGLGKTVLVNAIIGLPTIKQWRCVMDFEKDQCIAKNLKLLFPLIYNHAAVGLPPSVKFTSDSFIRPPTTKSIGHSFYMQTMEPDLETTDMTSPNK